MKKLAIIPPTIAALLLQGCIMGYDDGRQAHHKDIRIAEETTSQEFLKTKAKEVVADKGKKTNPTLKVTTYGPDGITVASVIEADIAPSIEAATGGKKYESNYGIDLKRSERPQGEFAENATAVGGAVVGGLQAPGGVAYITAKGVAAGIKESGGGGTHISAEEANIEGSFNKSESTTIGSGSSESSTAGTGGGTPKDKASGACTIEAIQLSDCRTTTNGPATPDEYNACLMRDYGHTPEEIAACPQ